MLKNLIVLFVVLSCLLNAKQAFASAETTNVTTTQTDVVQADDTTAENQKEEVFEVKNAWARASIPSNRNSAAYFEAVNNTNNEVVIISASTSLANNVELHNSFVDEKGVSRMTAIDRVVIPPRSTIEFKPGGMHVMLFNLKKPFNQGDKFHLDLMIENAEPIKVECEIKN